jgi:type II secretory pathway pseudopilin PulG
MDKRKWFKRAIAILIVTIVLSFVAAYLADQSVAIVFDSKEIQQEQAIINQATPLVDNSKLAQIQPIFPQSKVT